MNHANFIVDEITEDRVVIIDIGPWDRYPTVTSQAEYVVAWLVLSGKLTPAKRLFYHDSEGEAGELLVKWPEGTFAGFAPAPAELAS